MDCLYVCLFSNGHIKVGRSIDPVARIAAHVDRVSCMGVELVTYHIEACGGSSIRAEADLISCCAAFPGVTRFRSEWFSGLDFGTVCEWAQKFSHTIYEGTDRTKLREYLDGLPHGGAKDFALKASCNPVYLSQLAARHGGREASPLLTVVIERESGYAVRRWDLRPSDWHRIWPELIGTDGAPTP